MFTEKFFDRLDERVRFFNAQSGDHVEYGAVLIRTRTGAFHTMQVRAEDAWVSLVVYANPSVKEGEKSPVPKNPNGPTVGQIFVPYSEVVSVEMFPGDKDTAYLGGGLGDSDHVVGFKS